ncbi:MAG: tRNA pseudouridine(13) synthase TruD [Candidatus Heimdallarchaeota archaeon]|nr:tRNA pseudouridine(13) synthase TruD [Candidatus Heimdallarchaeota archaeon]
MKNNYSSELLTPSITKSQGIGGKIKHFPEDFIVSEIIDKEHILDPRADRIELPGKPGLFLHFVLVKKDIDTSDALDWIARLWKVERNDISIAGSKDKRAFTAQRVCIWGLKDKFERGVLDNLDLPKIKTHSLCLRLKEIRLGNLWGNAFNITIRDITRFQEETRRLVKESFEDIQTKGGVLNGFGIQRFGGLRPITHQVGKILVQGDFELAIKIYLGKIFDGESEKIQKARKIYWETDDCIKALEYFPKFLTIERKLLRELIKRRMNYEQVFFSLPQQFRKLFVHAFQAKLFNRYLTIRWNEYSQDLQKSITGETIKDGKIYAPIIGRKTVLSGDVKNIYEEILNEEEIDINLFQSQIIQKIGGQGTIRAISLLPNYMHENVLEDETNSTKTKAEISFTIPKGSYATELLREIMKT